MRRALPSLALALAAACAREPRSAPSATDTPAVATALPDDPVAREAALLAAGADGVARSADSLLVAGVLLVNDTSGADTWQFFHYDGRIERTPFHGVRVSFFEGRGYVLVHERTGAQVRVHARPVVSPSGARLATASLDLVAGFDPNALTILVPSGDTVAVAWTVAPDRWGPDSVHWRGDDTLHVVQRWITPRGPGEFERREALAVRRGTAWDLVQGPPAP